MQDRSRSSCFRWALVLIASVTLADDSAPGPTDTGTIRISFTVPERVQATASVARINSADAGCLTLQNSSAFTVNALIQDGNAWQLAPVDRQRSQSDRDSIDCDSDIATRFAIASNWHGQNGVITLLVSPL